MTSETLDLQREVELFLYAEAKLLDNALFEQWLALFTEDARYWMPLAETREAGKERSPAAGEWSLMEEDKKFLSKRYERLMTGMAHSEQPRSRTRRFITNVLVEKCADESLLVDSNILVFQSRRDSSEQFFVGCRQDVLVRDGDGWKIAQRSIFLDHRVLPRAISIFM